MDEPLSGLLAPPCDLGGALRVVAPLVATESLWGVGISALVLGREELVGRRLAAGAALVVAGGVLIGVFR